MTPPAATLYTIGHSNRTWDEFLGLLRAHGVKAVADVRRFPGSRRLPQYNDAYLAQNLPAAGIAYLPFPNLGGRRKPNPNSPNAGWRNESFRAYADYMQTSTFTAALDDLMAQAAQIPTAIMCAEAVPWRCHRSLIADALIVRGWQVLNIMSPTQAKQHKLTPFARVQGVEISYPPEEPMLPFAPRAGD